MTLKLVVASFKLFTQHWHHVYVIPVLFRSTLNLSGTCIATPFPRSAPPSVFPIRVPDGSHSGDVNAGICIFRTEQESYGSADLVLRMSHHRRHLDLLQEGPYASISSIHCFRWYRMFPQLWGGVYGVASWCMYSDHRCFCLWLTVETVFNGAPGRSPSAL